MASALIIIGCVLSSHARANCSVPYGKPVVNGVGAIFIGTVKSHNQVMEDDKLFSQFNKFISFDVSLSIKGNITDNIDIYHHDGVHKISETIMTHITPAVSSESFIVGNDYIIFSKYDDKSKLYRFKACKRNFIKMNEVLSKKMWYEDIITLYAILDMYPEIQTSGSLTRTADEMFSTLEKHKKFLCEENEDLKSVYSKRTMKVCD